MYIILVCQVAEPQVSRLCMEAEEFIAMEKWLELASLMVTSAELIFSKVPEKGRILHFLFMQFPLLKLFSILVHSEVVISSSFRSYLIPCSFDNNTLI